MTACGGGGDSSDNTPTGGNTSGGQSAYTVTPSVVNGSGGTISPSTAVSVKSGATTSFTLTPNSGYWLSSSGGTCGGALNGNTYITKAITGNCTVVAAFAANNNTEPLTFIYK